MCRHLLKLVGPISFHEVENWTRLSLQSPQGWHLMIDGKVLVLFPVCISYTPVHALPQYECTIPRIVFWERPRGRHVEDDRALQRWWQQFFRNPTSISHPLAAQKELVKETEKIVKAWKKRAIT